MSWDDRLCLGRAPDCEGMRGAPCDCFGPWTDAELTEAQRLLADMLARDATGGPPVPEIVYPCDVPGCTIRHTYTNVRPPPDLPPPPEDWSP